MDQLTWMHVVWWFVGSGICLYVGRTYGNWAAERERRKWHKIAKARGHKALLEGGIDPEEKETKT